MEKLSIIWDFDGTILPNTPFDSEQSLLRFRMKQTEQPFGWLKKGCAQAIIYADQRERFRKTFKNAYVRLLKGTPASTLEEVSRHLAQKISTADRSVFKELADAGHEMIVLSCGTADLSEHVLEFAGLRDCFRLIEGNRFRFIKDQISGMNFHIPDPDDKLAFAQNLNLSPEHTIVVGDGYTDLPLLNWSSIPVMIDRSGQKRKRFTSHDFYFISSIPELINIIQANIAKRQSSRRMKNKKLIVFDMDGVLIDVSRSYRDTVRQTAALFFKNAPGYEKLPEPFFPLTDLAAVKQSGGLNNDWDLSCLVINLLFDIIEKPPVYKHKDAWDRYRETISQCDVTPLAEFLNSTPNPLSTLHQKVGLSKNSFIYGLYSGDVSSGNIIKQIFQEVYLGQTLFEDTYRMVPQFYRGEGFNQREQLIINRNILEELAANHILAIATGRPRSEADYPLDHFELRKYFSEVLTLEDCLEEEEKIFKGKEKEVSLSKPHPFMLDAIAYRLKRPVEQYFYIGDMPDDMVAAKKSQTGYKGIGFILTAPDKESLKKELQRAGADTIIEDIDQLISFIASA